MYSDTVTASGSEDAVSSAIQTTDTTIVMGTASDGAKCDGHRGNGRDGSNRSSSIEDPEESARELAASLDRLIRRNTI